MMIRKKTLNPQAGSGVVIKGDKGTMLLDIETFLASFSNAIVIQNMFRSCWGHWGRCGRCGHCCHVDSLDRKMVR